MKNIIKPQSIKNMILFGLIATLPVRIDSTATWKSETHIKLYGVTGQYAHISRGCEGQIYDKEAIPFAEFGGSIDYKPTPNVRYGLLTSVVRTKQGVEDYYEERQHQRLASHIAINPFLNLEFDKFALGGGFLFMVEHSPREISTTAYTFDAFDRDESFSAYLRLGDPKIGYIDGSIFQKSPLLSRGVMTIGVGSQAIPNIKLWFGFGTIVPYDAFGTLSELSIGLRPNLSLDFFTRLGASEGIQESAIGIGFTYGLGGNK